MSTPNAFAGSGQPFNDIVLFNYGGSDIAAGLGVLWDTTAANKDGVVLPTAGGGRAGQVGITVETIPALVTSPGATAPGRGRVRVAGVAVGTAFGAITRGQWVRIDDTAAHLGQIKVTGAADEAYGQAMDTAADGEPVRVLVRACKNA